MNRFKFLSRLVSIKSASIGVTGDVVSAGELAEESLSGCIKPYSKASVRVASGLSLNRSASLRGNSGDGVGGSRSGSGIVEDIKTVGVGAGARGMNGDVAGVCS